MKKVTDTQYLEKLEELRQNREKIYSPLFDFLKRHRPGVPRGLLNSEMIKCILEGCVILETNEIGLIMIELGYKVVYCDIAEEYGWNITEVPKDK